MANPVVGQVVVGQAVNDDNSDNEVELEANIANIVSQPSLSCTLTPHFCVALLTQIPLLQDARAATGKCCGIKPNGEWCSRDQKDGYEPYCITHYNMANSSATARLGVLPGIVPVLTGVVPQIVTNDAETIKVGYELKDNGKKLVVTYSIKPPNELVVLAEERQVAAERRANDAVRMAAEVQQALANFEVDDKKAEADH